MRKFSIFSILIGVAALLATSCSDIDENERFTYVRPADVSRAVLVEDFTGQRCVNCPNANDVIHQLQEEYGDSNVIAVGIHSGPLGFKGNSRMKGLATDLGDTYYYHFGAEYQPVGMVNRHGLADYTTWSGLVHDALQEPATVELSLHSNYDSASRVANLNVEALALDNAVSGNLQVWMIEDSVIAFQLMPNGAPTDNNYVHNHVFRASVNDPWGDAVNIPAQQTSILPYSYTVPEEYDAKHCSFVVFIYNDSGVLQVSKVKVEE